MHYVTRMYLGRNKPDGAAITDAEFNGFVRAIVAVAFPNGFTIIHAEGGWNGSTGFIREPSAILEVYHNGATPARHAVRNVATAYRNEFQQDAVMVSTTNLTEGVEFV